MAKKCCDAKDPARLNKVGGQAVLEGVMMKAGSRTVTTCRKEDGSLAVYESNFVSVRKKHKILDIPILRGVVNFVEMMILSVISISATKISSITRAAAQPVSIVGILPPIRRMSATSVRSMATSAMRTMRSKLQQSSSTILPMCSA
jgi:hypothetical protein